MPGGIRREPVPGGGGRVTGRTRGYSKDVLGRVLLALSAGVVGFGGLGAASAGALGSAPIAPVAVDPSPVTVGPVTVDPSVTVSPSGDVHVGVVTQAPAPPASSISVDVGTGGAQVSGPGGLAVGVALPPPAGTLPVSLPPISVARTPGVTSPATNPTQPAADARAAPAGDAAAAGATSSSRARVENSLAKNLPTNLRERGADGGAEAARVGTATANLSPAPDLVGGHIADGGPATAPWSRLWPVALALGPWLALVGLAAFLRVLAAAAGRRSLSPS